MGLTPAELKQKLLEEFHTQQSNSILQVLEALRAHDPVVVLAALPDYLQQVADHEMSIAECWQKEQGESTDPHSPQQTHVRMAEYLAQQAINLQGLADTTPVEWEGVLNPFIAQGIGFELKPKI